MIHVCLYENAPSFYDENVPLHDDECEALICLYENGENACDLHDHAYILHCDCAFLLSFQLDDDAPQGPHDHDCKPFHAYADVFQHSYEEQVEFLRHLPHDHDRNYDAYSKVNGEPNT